MADDETKSGDSDASEAAMNRLVEALTDANQAGAPSALRRAQIRDIAWVASRALAKAHGKGEASQGAYDFSSAFQIAALSPFDAAAWARLAQTALVDRKLEVAMSAAMRAAANDPQSERGYAIAAEASVAMGNYELGAQFLTAALRVGSPDPALASDVIGKCFVAGNGSDQVVSQISSSATAVAESGARAAVIAAFTKAYAGTRNDVLGMMLLRSCAPLEAHPHIAPADKPVVLISQIQRSGGTLISQLFDGHPEIFAHPHELQIGRPEKWNWPSLDLDVEALELLNQLTEAVFAKYVIRGYSKGDGNKAAAKDFRPFNFSFETLCARFVACRESISTQRQAINAYLYSFFQAWRDHKPSGREKFYLGFTPRLNMHEASVERFFRDYPDGRFISCVRDPISWFSSSRLHDAEYQTIENAMSLWSKSVEASIKLAEANPTNVRLVDFSSITTDVETEMYAIADWLGIERRASLCVPTFAGQSILPNSSYQIDQFGVAEPVSAAKLDTHYVEFIRQHAWPLYDRARKAIESQKLSQ